MNLKAVAEGVETEDQKTLLRLLGCDHFQGYLFGKPLPICDYAALTQRAVAPFALHEDEVPMRSALRGR